MALNTITQTNKQTKLVRNKIEPTVALLNCLREIEMLYIGSTQQYMYDTIYIGSTQQYMYDMIYIGSTQQYMYDILYIDLLNSTCMT